MKSLSSTFACTQMQAALKARRDSLGKETKPHHYINEVGLVRHAMTGNSRADYDLANPPVGRKRITRRIICLNTSLIAAGVAYEQRKKICRAIALKYEAKSLK
jgi:hypothetical protein